MIHILTDIALIVMLVVFALGVPFAAYLWARPKRRNDTNQPEEKP